MRAIATDAVTCVCVRACVCVCLVGTTVSRAKTDKPIEMPSDVKTCVKKKCHRVRTVGGVTSPFLRPWARRWINHWSLWRMASATPDLRLPSQPQGITAPWPVPKYLAWWQKQTCVNNLPKVVSCKRNGRDSNPRPSESQVQRSNDEDLRRLRTMYQMGCSLAPRGGDSNYLRDSCDVGCLPHYFGNF